MRTSRPSDTRTPLNVTSGERGHVSRDVEPRIITPESSPIGSTLDAEEPDKHLILGNMAAATCSWAGPKTP
jgi:hypothetical protein